MTTINANMTSSVLWVPLSEADSLATEPGYYTIDSEQLVLAGFHMTHPNRGPSATSCTKTRSPTLSR